MLKKNNIIELNHLLSMDTLNQSQIQSLINRANEFANSRQTPIIKDNDIKIITNLFFEPSTRTQYAFEIAAHRLKVKTITPDIPNLSTLKGESLIDTLVNLETLGCSLFIIRHPINHTPEFIASELHTDTRVLNAGDGTNEHPSQALTDIMTIEQHFSDFSQLKVAILGDTFHSRVARSLTTGLITMGVTNICYITPPELIIDSSNLPEIVKQSSTEEGLHDADIIVCLRAQKERFEDPTLQINQNTYSKHYSLTQEKLALAKPDAIVMHPGPINRGIEIESEVADGLQSVILQQAKNSIYIRMAILEALLSF